MSEEAKHIRFTITERLDEGKDVVLVMNSHGGILRPQAVEGLGKNERQAAGNRGAVIHLVYMASFLLPKDTSLDNMLAGNGPAATQAPEDYLSFPVNEAEHIFSQLDGADRTHYAQQLQYHSVVTFPERLTFPAYEHIPTTCLVSLDDAAVPTAPQHKMVDAAIAKGANVTKVELHSDHCPQISHPKEVVNILVKVAARSTQ